LTANNFFEIRLWSLSSRRATILAVTLWMGNWGSGESCIGCQSYVSQYRNGCDTDGNMQQESLQRNFATRDLDHLQQSPVCELISLFFFTCGSCPLQQLAQASVRRTDQCTFESRDSAFLRSSLSSVNKFRARARTLLGRPYGARRIGAVRR
jgi:hypothetical protein